MALAVATRAHVPFFFRTVKIKSIPSTSLGIGLLQSRVRKPCHIPHPSPKIIRRDDGRAGGFQIF
jgi:hypothetical protein